jgi:membrane-bound inhibitor of C-type lysozyme
MMTWLVPTASDSKYEGQNVMFWIKGDEAVFSSLGDEIQCRVRSQ